MRAATAASLALETRGTTLIDECGRGLDRGGRLHDRASGARHREHDAAEASPSEPSRRRMAEASALQRRHWTVRRLLLFLLGSCVAAATTSRLC